MFVRANLRCDDIVHLIVVAAIREHGLFLDALVRRPFGPVGSFTRFACRATVLLQSSVACGFLRGLQFGRDMLSGSKVHLIRRLSTER